MSTHTSGLCLEVEESLADILEGTAAARLYDHIAECDTCRDKRHDAEMAIEAVAESGADFRAPEGFEDRILAGVLEARPQGPQHAPQSHGQGGHGQSESGPFPRVSAPVPAGSANAGYAATELAPVEPLASDRTILKAPTMLGDVHGAPTIIEPAPAGARPTGPTLPSELEDASQRPSAAFVPSHKTVPLAAVAGTLAEARAALSAQPTPAPMTPAAQTPRSADAASYGAAPVVDAVTGNIHTGSAVAGSPQHGASPTYAGAAAQPAADSAIALDVRKNPPIEPVATAQHGQAQARPVPVKALPVKAETGGVVSLFRRPGFVATLAGGMAAAAAAGYFWLGQPKKTDGPTDATAFVEGAWSGSVGSVSRASTDGASGFEVCTDKCTALAQGGEIKPGATLKTDAKTRAKVTLVDGTALFLDRSSELSFAAGSTREAKVTKGLVVADVAKADKAAPAKFVLPQGQVEVVGTKLAITATDRRATVEVLRGEVRVKNDSTKWASVRAGEEAILPNDGAPSVVAKQSMSDVLEWSDKDPEDVDAAALRGVGELKAKKPGETTERAGAVTLTKHSTKVRVVDVVARTEIDETFTNNTDDELEGIFRFPLPPGAQIEKLELEVEGKLIEGAFVDRERGAAIWRGVIQNAAPKAPKPKEEIIWVAGPWRDPALLEWQRGGRFELKIFPIPKKGSRRVVLTYTQTVPQAGGIRRFSYPLAHDGSGSTKIDEFSLDVQVLGHDKAFGVSTRGYDLKAGDAPAGADRFKLDERAFVPAGDLTVEYALPNRTSEMTAWAFEAPAGTASATSPTNTTANVLANAQASISGSIAAPVAPTGKAATKAEREKLAKDQAAQLASDTSPYVAISLRPTLPRFAEGKERLHVIVVDSSRSMIGERFARAKRLASSLVKEMDRRDSFMLMACDITCQGLGATAGRPLPELREPSAEASADVDRFLGSIEPDGGSNLFATVQAAKTAAGFARGKELRIIYLGDGTPTVGPTRPASLEAAIKHALPDGEGSIVSVALGTDADTSTLGAMARGGGGVMVPYVPGQRVSAAAFDVLNAAYGTVLSDVSVELPPGLAEITPAAMDPIAAGGEAFVFARMTGSNKVEGNVKIRGRVGNERFEQVYPANIQASTEAGNGFVPRMFAAAKISDLERSSRLEDRERAVALSQRFAVASRFTSLLVLESDAMFKAFGLDRNAIDSTFSGELAATSTSAEAEGKDARKEEEANKGSADKAKSDLGFDGDDAFRAADEEASSLGGLGFGGGGRASSGAAAPATEAAPAEKKAAPAKPSPTSAPPAPPMQAARPDPSDPFSADFNNRGPSTSTARPAPPRDRGMVAMRKVFDRKASFVAGNNLTSELAQATAEAEAAQKLAPDSRDKTVALFKVLLATGRIGEAQELTARWAERDALDADALFARADLAAMSGDRERAIRILSGIADVRPGDKSMQTRLIGAFTQLGAREVACQQRMSLADIDLTEITNVAGAVKCSRDLGFTRVASAFVEGVDPQKRDAVEAASRTVKLEAGPITGDTRIAATWAGGGDLDFALIDKNGRRFSWLGSPVKTVGVNAADAGSTRNETVGFSGLQQGNYVIEVTRATPSNQPVSGEVTLTLPGGESRKVPFNLTGNRAELGSLRVFFTSRLVPVDDVGSFGWRR